MLPTFAPAAPHDAPQPTISSRRALLWSAAALTCGALLSGTTGFLLARGARQNAQAEAELAALQQFVTKAPLRELVDDWQPLAAALLFDHPHDAQLWRGFERLLDWALAHADAVPPQLLTFLCTALAQGAPPRELADGRALAALRRLHHERLLRGVH